MADEIDNQMQVFYQTARSDNAGLRPPRKAIEAAEAVVSFSQSAKIQTMDSFFFELVSQFPVEAGSQIPTPFKQADTAEVDELHKESFDKLFLIADKQQGNLRSLLRTYFKQADATPDALHKQIRQIFDRRTFFFSLKQHGKIAHWQDLLLAADSEFANLSSDELYEFALRYFKDFGDHVNGKVSKANFAAHLQNFKNERSWQDLQDAIFKKGGFQFRRNFLKKLSPEEQSTIVEFFAEIRRRQLNATADLIFQIYKAYQAIYEQIRLEKKLVQYDDITLGAYRLFYGEENFGALYNLFLKTSHLLVDEFQDTSRIQWDIFSVICSELLSGQGLAAERGLQPTVFLVGDAKQSIYAFRDGDYQLLAEAAEVLGRMGSERVALDKSWRSSDFLLRQVNAVFESEYTQGKLPDFAPHATAQLEDRPIVPDYGSFTLVEPLLPEAGENMPELKEKEAVQIVAIIQTWIKTKLPVYDKELGYHRPVRLDDIGILYARKTRMPELEAAFIAHGIAYEIEERRGYYTRREVDDVLHFLHFLAQPDDDVALSTLLRSPFLRLTDAELMHLLRMRSEADSQPSLFTLVQKHHQETARILYECRNRLGSFSIAHVLLYFFEATQALAAYKLAFGEAEGTLAASNLQHIIQIVGTGNVPGNGTIRDYSQMLRRFRGVDETGNVQLAEERVKMMTMHKAKGLEFPVVILLGGEVALRTTEDDRLKKAKTGFLSALHHEPYFAYKGRVKSERMPEATRLTREYIRRANDQEERENMRLLYVTMTRAQEHMLVTCLGDPGTASFYSTLQYCLFPESEREEIAPDIFGYQRKELPLEAAKAVSAIPDEKVKPRVYANEKIEESGIRLVQPSSQSTVPFDEDDEIHIDELAENVREQEKSRIAGTLIHTGLAAKINETQWHLSHALQQEMLTASFRFSDDERNALQKAVATQIDMAWNCTELQDLLKQSVQPPRVEMPFTHLQGEALVNGVIDLLIFTDNACWIIDYKSHLNQDKALDLDEEARTYKRQLTFYRKAVKVLFACAKIHTAVLFTASGQFVEA
ncbi:MAG: hypothetical protein DWQ10_03815 [Calditrichaeota bacterium]|nr:MAG: hypothetical protein DWQ10_03815 [Calditrichota bacterium]